MKSNTLLNQHLGIIRDLFSQQTWSTSWVAGNVQTDPSGFILRLLRENYHLKNVPKYTFKYLFGSEICLSIYLEKKNKEISSILNT